MAHLEVVGVQQRQGLHKMVAEVQILQYLAQT
jgi:hypothetical protein